MTLADQLKSRIADVPNFPKDGILFRDVTPLLADAASFAAVTNHFADRYRGQGITQIVAVESRGFIFGAPVATALGVGLTLVRKRGKLPRETHIAKYDLEYGTDELHMHADALTAKDRVVIIDDVLATGGTALATATLVEKCGATVHELAFLIELGFLPGREKLGARPVSSLIVY